MELVFLVLIFTELGISYSITKQNLRDEELQNNCALPSLNVIFICTSDSQILNQVATKFSSRREPHSRSNAPKKMFQLTTGSFILSVFLFLINNCSFRVSFSGRHSQRCVEVQLHSHPQGVSNNHYPVPIQHNFLSTPIYLRLILILSSHLHQGLPKGLFPVGYMLKF